MPPEVVLIVPCFNEAARLDFARLATAPDGVTLLLVDDGSRDGTSELIERHQSDVLRLLRLSRNVGKGEAIRQGFLHASGQGWLAEAGWVGYWDADLATPLSELAGFFEYAELSKLPVDGIFGCRVHKLGSTIVRSPVRHVLGRIFTTVAAAMLRVECYDSQCGAKVIRTAVAEDAFREPFVSRWIFDLEILARLHGRYLIEYPLRTWVDVRGSKLSVVKVAVPTLLDLVRIRRRYRR